jgi:SAM-dependent methyltransferase
METRNKFRERTHSKKMNLFSEEDLLRIYQTKVKLPRSYFTKYERLPSCPSKTYNYSWGNFDFPRNICILDFQNWMKKYNIKVNKLGYTCDSDPELEFLEYKTKTKFEFPQFDLHTISLKVKEKFDFFLFNQTIEHLYNPFLAMQNIYSILNDGGYVFTSVPTLNIPHSTPIHYNGYNPMGLAMLFKSVGFEIIDIGQWGNYEYICQLWKTHSWPGYEQINHDGIVTNEEQNVCQCWILARKPNSSPE